MTLTFDNEQLAAITNALYLALDRTTGNQKLRTAYALGIWIDERARAVKRPDMPASIALDGNELDTIITDTRD